MVLLLLFPAASSFGQFPDKEMLDKLRERLLETSDAFPDAATIASLDVAIQDGKLQMNLEVHAAAEVALPLPGKLPICSPVSVRFVSAAPATDPVSPDAATQLEPRDALVCRREDGFLWVVVPPGVHTLRVEGNLPDTNEWVLAFSLLPKRVSLAAPQWHVFGLAPTGVPDSQLFFSRFEKSAEGEAKLDQRL